MNLFSISQLSQFSGIKPHTIRMWEQRYNALTPNRSEGNTRYYDNSQLRRLLNIVSLMESGHKVSDLCAMPDKQIFGLLNPTGDTNPNDKTNYYISQLIAAGMSYDEAHFEKIFSHCLLQHGLRDAYIKVIYPMLVRIGLMWSSNSIPPAHEHFISNLVRQKLFTAIDLLPPPKDPSNPWLLFLPENEFHEMGLLFSYYLIRAAGVKAIYLGANVPFKSVCTAISDMQPSNLLLFLVHRGEKEEIEKYLGLLNDAFTGKKIYVAANSSLDDSKSKKRIHFLNSVETLEQVLS